MVVAELSSPGSQRSALGLPAGTGFVEFSVFASMVHNSSRLSLKNEELWWCENFLPLGKNRLRSLPGAGVIEYTVPGGQITLTAGGYNGADGQYPLLINGGGGSAAAGYFIVIGGSVAAIYITAPGSGYTTAPTIAFNTCPNLVGASALATPEAGSFALSIVAHYNFNINSTLYLALFYADGGASFLKKIGTVFVPVAVAQPSTFAVQGLATNNPIGRQWGNKYFLIIATNGYWIFDGTLLYTAGTVSPTITITNVGSGYTSQPTITVSGGSGSGATFTATIINQQIVNITCTNPGNGYAVSDAHTLNLLFSGGGGTSAAATIELMPFGVQGTSIESYQQRVWIINGDLLIFSAPASCTDFDSASGAGTTESTESSLRIGYTRLIAQAGFLYVIADSSVSYISGVQTGGSPLVTTFGLTAIDTEFGTIWRDSVQAFGRGVIFATFTGVYAVYGGTVEKISSQIDDLFGETTLNTSTILNTTNLAPSSAIVEMYGMRYYALLLPITDETSTFVRKKILLWNKASWSIATQEYDFTKLNWYLFNSVIYATATDGYKVYLMMQNYSANTLPRLVISKLWDAPAFFTEKSSWRLAGLFTDENLSTVLATSAISIDIENEQNTATYELNYITDPKWTVRGQKRFVIAVEQAGYLVGFTVRTTQPITLQSLVNVTQQYRLAL